MINVNLSQEQQEPEPSTSGYRWPPGGEDQRNRHTDGTRDDCQVSTARRSDAAAAAPQALRRGLVEAENAKATLLLTKPGNEFQFTAKTDEDYLVVGGHIDQSMQDKIIRCKYVDFGKLLPRDKIVMEEDGRLELVVRNGKTFWVPVSESVAINGFSHWEQAFRVYSNIYTSKFPEKSTQLIQYNHVIHSIAGIYSWDNVYSYDKEFRLHMAKHPDRNWSIILQQAWSMKLHSNQQVGSSLHQNIPNGGNTKAKSGEPCRRFNCSHCNFGSSCRYDHRCAYGPCGKFGHNILNCRMLQADRERNVCKSTSKTGGATSHSDRKDK